MTVKVLVARHVFNVKFGDVFAPELIDAFKPVQVGLIRPVAQACSPTLLPEALFDVLRRVLGSCPASALVMLPELCVPVPFVVHT